MLKDPFVELCRACCHKAMKCCAPCVCVCVCVCVCEREREREREGEGGRTRSIPQDAPNWQVHHLRGVCAPPAVLLILLLLLQPHTSTFPMFQSCRWDIADAAAERSRDKAVAEGGLGTDLPSVGELAGGVARGTAYSGGQLPSSGGGPQVHESRGTAYSGGQLPSSGGGPQVHEFVCVCVCVRTRVREIRFDPSSCD